MLAISSSFVYTWFAAYPIPVKYIYRHRMEYVEIIFLIDLLLKFITSIDNPTSINDETIIDLSIIGVTYLKGDFI